MHGHMGVKKRLFVHQNNKTLDFEMSWLPNVVLCFQKKEKILLLGRHALKLLDYQEILWCI
jgi:hypothetical protein